MFEESIDGSPHKANSSIHSTRIRRRKQRRCDLTDTLVLSSTLTTNVNNTTNLDSNEQLNCEQQQTCFTLAQMYWEQDDPTQPNRTFTVRPDFDPFEDQMLLAAADRLSSIQQRKQNNNLPVPSNGFQKCEVLAEIVAGSLAESNNEITDTELLQICEQVEEAEKDGNETVIASPETPQQVQQSKSIVDLILEDFGCSPLSPPIEFKRSLRTYSRRRRKKIDASLTTTPTRQSFAEQLDRVALSLDNDDCLSVCSTSSGLSMQEDHTQLSVPPIQAKISQKAYENLLNLSAYFTQEEENVEPDAFTTTTSSSSPMFQTANADEVEEREKQPVEMPFHLAHSQPLADILTLRQKYPVSLSRRSSCSSADFCGFPSFDQVDGIDMVMNFEPPATAIDTETLNTDTNDALCLPPDAESKMSLSQCVTTIKQADPLKQCDVIINDNPNKRVHKDALSFSDDDEWLGDCDFFLNFNTQDALKAAATTKLKAQPTTTSSTSLKMPASQQLNSAIHLKNTGTSKTNTFVGFQTAAAKKIHILAAAQARAAQLLQDLPELPTKNEIKEPKFQGFQTASRKTIAISEEAKKRAEALLAAVPNLEDCDFLLDADGDDKPSTSKAAALKNVAQKTAVMMHNDNKLVGSAQLPQFVGFRTASRKSIQISEEAKIRAASILAELPEIPQKIEKRVADTQQNSTNILKDEIEATVLIAAELQDIQFSEWLLTPPVETQEIPVQTTDETVVLKRKLPTEETKQNLKIECNSHSISSLERSPLNRIENATKSTIISRRNLLSLSKRKKNRPLSTGSSGSGSGETIVTPIKNNSNNRAHIQTPGTPNLREFFDSSPTNTSTPRPTNSNAIAHALSLVEEEKHPVKDFKQMICNNSKSSDAAHSKSVDLSKSVGNVSANAVKPSPKQRIEHLRRYGEPPAVSPILMASHNNCRPSGLRRANAGRGLSLNKSKK